MIIRKDLILAVLVAFCLAATLFMIIPTRSQIGGYDPWADIDDSGRIDMYDIGYAARLFAAEGDPTRNVTIMNSYTGNQIGPFQLLADWATMKYILTEGFREIDLGIYSDGACKVGIHWYEGNSTHGRFYLEQEFDIPFDSLGILKVLSVHGSQLGVFIRNTNSSTISCVIDYYMTT